MATNLTTVTLGSVTNITQTTADIQVTIANINPIGNGITKNANDWAQLSLSVRYGTQPFPNISSRTAAFFNLYLHNDFLPNTSPAPGYAGATSYTTTVTITKGTGPEWDGDIYIQAASNLSQFTGTGSAVTFATVFDNAPVFQFASDPLQASFVKTDVTVNGGSDGTITVTASGGSGNYTYVWTDGPTTPLRTGLSANIYDVQVNDTVTAEQVLLSIQINEPDPAVVEEPEGFLDVPKMQTLHFVVPEAIDNCSTFQTLDNRLLNDQEHPDYNNLAYCQLFQQCDSFSVQFRSSYSNVSAKLVTLPGLADTVTYTPVRTVQGLNQEQTFDVRLQDNGSSQTRIYFVGSSALPVVVNTGDTFSLFNTTNTIDNTYQIISILQDTALNQQYLVINASYNSVNSSETGTATFVESVLPFDIYEFSVDFSAIPVGDYRIEITTQNIAQTIQLNALSEPINVQVSQPDTIFISWTNIDNAFDIDYTNNIIHRMRLRGQFFNRLPSFEVDGFRDIPGNFTILSAKPQRRVRINFFDIPPYLIEKIAIAFRNDVVRVNGILVTSEEGLEEVAYRTRYGLNNATLVVEQQNWFNNYNTDDPGVIELPTEALILRGQEGFIKR